MSEQALDEEEQLYRYRKARFRELGFPDVQAEKLADAGVDWHAAEDLLERGCSVEQAWWILA